MDVPDSRIAEDERHKAKQVGLCCTRLSTLLLHVTHVHGFPPASPTLSSVGSCKPIVSSKQVSGGGLQECEWQIWLHVLACKGWPVHVQEEEQAALDDEAERRRKRVQAWQEQKANALVAEEAAALKAANKAKGWSLEDDLDEVCH